LFEKLKGKKWIKKKNNFVEDFDLKIVQPIIDFSRLMPQEFSGTSLWRNQFQFKFLAGFF